MRLGPFVKLIRWKNLLMLALIQILFRFVYFSEFSVATTLNTITFYMLVAATLLIAAAGYIINDIYDIEADKINKPSKVFVSQAFSIKQAWFFYYLFNIMGLSLGFYVAYTIGRPTFIAIFLIVMLLLKVYNSDLKKLPLLGNALISLLVSLAILIIGIFDIIPAITPENEVEQYYAFKVMTDYAIFAFMFMFLREMIKDIEDVNGDRKMRMKTLPILVGRKRARYIVFGFCFIPLILVTYYSFDNFGEVPFVLAYMLIVVLIPLLYTMTKILNSKTKKDDAFTSWLLKFIMLLGILSIVIISIQFYYAE